jgi:Xaa-Pro aminopeptidase
MYQIDFSREELASRRARVMAEIGKDAVALIQGGPKESAHDLFRQTNDFYHLCGVEVPHAYLLVDGRSSTSTLFLPHQSQEQKDGEGEVLSPENAQTAKTLTGIEEVRGIEELTKALEKVRLLHTPMRIGEGALMSWDTVQRAQQDAYSDPWDGRPDRMRAFVSLLRERCPAADIRDLSAVMDELRFIKSPREVDLMRMAGKLSALGVTEAMRSTRPGVWEYELDAVMRYVYLVNGARDWGYRAIIAGGPNIHFGHYKANNAQLQSGDLLLLDCAPEYRYYTSDIGRMLPVNGTYSREQRQLYGFIVAYHKVFLELIRPGVTAEEITAEASARMKPVVEATKWYKPSWEQGARAALEFPFMMTHPVGMSVHDVGHYRTKVIRPGTVLTLDPSLWVREEHIYIRSEDTMVVTETGFENFTAQAPLELDDVETTMKQEGMLQRYPAIGR